MGFDFKKTKLPKVDPGYITGKKAFEIRDRIYNNVKEKFNSNPFCKVNVINKNGIDYLSYKSFFDLFFINMTIKEEGFRVIEYSDQLLNEYIPGMIKEYKSLDFPELIIQNSAIHMEKNKRLFKSLVDILKKSKNELKYPFKIKGLELKNLRDKSDYGLAFIPRNNKIKNVEISFNEAFKYSYNGQEKFSNLDSNGEPMVELRGKKSIYLNRYGIGVLSTNKKLEIDSACGNLVNRGGEKIVMIVRNRPRYTGEKIIK